MFCSVFSVAGDNLTDWNDRYAAVMLMLAIVVD